MGLQIKHVSNIQDPDNHAWFIQDRESGKWLTSSGTWIEHSMPTVNTNIARFDEHGANLFLVGYEQALRDTYISYNISLRGKHIGGGGSQIGRKS